MSNEIEFRVWIGCLACYNGGDLVGKWFDAAEAGDVTPEDIHPGTFTTKHVGLNPNTHEEMWCFDIEAPHESLAHEMSPMEAQRIADVLAAFEELRCADEVGPFLAYLANHGMTLDEDAFDSFEDAYSGEWSSKEEYAENLAEDIGAVDPDASWPNSYIDWERAARDLFMDYTAIDNPDGGIWVYRD